MLHRFKGFQFYNFKKKLYTAISKMWLQPNYGFVKFESLKSNDVPDVCDLSLSCLCSGRLVRSQLDPDYQ